MLTWAFLLLGSVKPPQTLGHGQYIPFVRPIRGTQLPLERLANPTEHPVGSDSNQISCEAKKNGEPNIAYSCEEGAEHVGNESRPSDISSVYISKAVIVKFL